MHNKKSINKVCLITPGHICTNPRLVKEAITLIKNNFQVHIIFTQYIEKLIVEDIKILNSNPTITYDVLDWTGHNLKSKLRRIIAGAINKLSKISMPFLGFSYLNKLAINRNYNWQLAKATKQSSDLYIAHNLGALPIAVLAGLKNKSKIGFDAEDFHRYEISDNDYDLQVKLKKYVETTYMPKADYITAASPLIAKQYQNILNKNVISILNVFPKQKAFIKINTSETLKLFWFSQTIGPLRGLETLIESICTLKRFDIELNLLGEIDENYQSKLISILKSNGISKEKVKFHNTISPNLIYEFGSQFDIGIASETSFSTNNNIALSNKIFTYLQCKLLIIASDTDAQRELLEENPSLGLLYKKNDVLSLSEILRSVLANKTLLINGKKNAAYLAEHNFNWEIEQLKFLNIIKYL